ncbi:MAG: lipid-A-disaccharide synthase-related protein [Cyanobacteria bacterium P01_F01_bin.86]
MPTANRLLCISNGHGEDTIAVRILMALRSRLPDLELAALPIVGEGRVFRKQDIPVIAATKTLPSGGFIYMDSRQLARDLQGGLVQLTLKQLQAVKTWALDGGTVLAVGDLIPMAFAWWSGLPYGVVGTAKSAYYLRDEQGRLVDLPWHAGWAGSIYLPWERFFMHHNRCRVVVVRDDLTAQELRALGVSSVYTGNPMMDGLEPTASIDALRPPREDALTVVLLPGSRTPEAYANWQVILKCVAAVQRHFQPRWVHFLGAIAPALDLLELCPLLEAAGWQSLSGHPHPYFQQGNGSLLLTQTAYANCLHLADTAIAMAGTATEQFVGLGKPAFITPGQGPQFTPTFATLQTRLLGPSLTLVDNPDAMGTAMAQVLKNPDRLTAIHQNGLQRMGTTGAAAAIATALTEQLLE